MKKIFFRHLKNQISIDLHKDLDEYQNHLLYYLAYQAYKVYLNAQFNANNSYVYKKARVS
ncbi:hypothetical protein C1646_731784, partial [Rhizophagus diaphanus]